MAQKSFVFLALMVVITISGVAEAAPSRREVLSEAVRTSAPQAPTKESQPVTVAQEKVSPVQQVVTTVTPVGCNGTGPDFFASAASCVEAMKTAECSFYTPDPKNKTHKKNPADSKVAVVLPLGAPACVLEHTRYGIVWVPQKKGDVFRWKWRESADGEPERVPYARHDCGNTVKGIVYPAPSSVVKKVELPPSPPAVYSQAVVAPSPTPAPPPLMQTGNICTDNGFVGPQYYPAWTDNGQLACFEKLPWYAWDNIKVPVIATVVVGTVVYCATTHRCGDFLRKKSTASSTTGTTGGGGGGTGGNTPSGGQAIGNTGGTGGQAISSTGAVGANGTGSVSPVGGRATY